MTDYRLQKDHASEVPGQIPSLIHVEQAAFPAMAAVNLSQQSAAVQQTYKNFVLVGVNDHCVRMAVMTGEYRWHHHPHSDECFLVVERLLEIDFADRPTIQLRPGEMFTIPAGVSHRTRAKVRTVNLCFENTQAYTDVVFDDHAV
jgi:mannose-6-phosphate isomerase-like protein (cupin superfamily)